MRNDKALFCVVTFRLRKLRRCSTDNPGAKTINVFRACLGAQLTICAQKLRNFVLFSTVSLRFVWSRVCVFLYSLGPWSPPRDGLSGSFIPPSLFTIPPTSPPPPASPPATISQIRLDQDYGERTRSEAAASSGVELRCHDDAFTGLKLRANY